MDEAEGEKGAQELNIVLDGDREAAQDRGGRCIRDGAEVRSIGTLVTGGGTGRSPSRLTMMLTVEDVHERANTKTNCRLPMTNCGKFGYTGLEEAHKEPEKHWEDKVQFPRPEENGVAEKVIEEDQCLEGIHTVAGMDEEKVRKKRG
jgi:hypothetical protein